jgi:hypothetical protein
MVKKPFNTSEQKKPIACVIFLYWSILTDSSRILNEEESVKKSNISNGRFDMYNSHDLCIFQNNSKFSFIQSTFLIEKKLYI